MDTKELLVKIGVLETLASNVRPETLGGSIIRIHQGRSYAYLKEWKDGDNGAEVVSTGRIKEQAKVFPEAAARELANILSDNPRYAGVSFSVEDSRKRSG